MVDKKELEPRVDERERVADLPPMAESIRQAQDKSPRKSEQNLEVESWMEKIEKRFSRIPKGQPGAQDDTVVIAPADDTQSKQPPVQLPVNQQQMQTGKKAPVESGIAWLVTWALRRIKMLTRLGRKVRLEEIPEIKQEPTKTET